MHRLLSIPLVFLALLYTSGSIAQIGGSQTYQFLNLTNSARIAGMGGDFLTIKDNDVTLSLANPSLITPDMNDALAFSFVHYVTDVNYGFITYSHTFEKTGSFAGSFQYINYGKFTRADETGVTYGSFSASEYALDIGWGRTLTPHFSIGANGKLIYSHLDTYNSFGIAVDVAGTYTSNDDLFTASVIARNLGIQLVTYTPGTREPVPFELQAGFSTRFRHIPLRFSLLYNHIEKWDIRYDDPTDPANQSDPLTGQTKQKSDVSKFADNFMRHIVLGGELSIAKAVYIRLGYNYQRRQELKLYGKAGLSGFSYGFGIRIKMFNFSYTRATYMAGPINPNYITFAVGLNQFPKKKQAETGQ